MLKLDLVLEHIELEMLQSETNINNYSLHSHRFGSPKYITFTMYLNIMYIQMPTEKLYIQKSKNDLQFETEEGVVTKDRKFG